jgi:carbon storage regulator
MLVLSRKVDERILIGDGIEVQVLSIIGGRVRLGVTAPRDVTVLRAELEVEPPAGAAQEAAA